jgi:hypothetical protein
MRFITLPDDGRCDEEEDPFPWEPAGHGAIATGNAASCATFWRTFVRIPVVMTWIEEGCRLMWIVLVAPKRKDLSNTLSAMEHSPFGSGAVAEMLSFGALRLLPRDHKPTMVVSPLGVVQKPHTNTYRLAVSLR